jgi:Flp pilus assembly protein TadG
VGIPILTFVGAAIDYSRANKARSSMQSALDSTALMLAKDLTDGTISSSDIQTKAKTYFTALYTTKEAIVSPDSIQATYKSASQISRSSIQSERRSRNCASRNSRRQTGPKKKARPRWPGFLSWEVSWRLSC